MAARGYAESVGESAPPLWLGDIQVAKPELDVREPQLPLPELSGPTTLIALPDATGALHRWWGPAHPAEDTHAP